MPEGNHLQGLLTFGRFLRSRGLRVTPARMIDLSRAFAHCDLSSYQDVFLAGRVILVDRMEDLPVYDRAFVDFWRPQTADGAPEAAPHALPHVGSSAPEDSAAPPITKAEPGQPRSRRFGKPVPAPPIDADPGEGEGAGKLSYSPTESIHERQLAALTVDEIRATRKVMAEIRWDVASRESRRLVHSRVGTIVDWRRSFRRNVKHGGVLLELEHQEPKTVLRPIVVLCDVSGSMDKYTRPILHFVHSLAAGSNRFESFVFGTRLTRVTRLVGGRNADQALQRVSFSVTDWSGGTRIGGALREFNRRWSRRVLGRGAVVLIVSDGWDKGDPVLLQTEIARLQRRCHRLIWLNPAHDESGKIPVPLGMRAAMPFIDDLLPARNLADLAELGRLISSLHAGRPVRSAAPRPAFAIH